jgi:hypothetical protein
MATPPRANLSREEPDAGNLHVRLCEGWGWQRPHLLGNEWCATAAGGRRRWVARPSWPDRRRTGGGRHRTPPGGGSERVVGRDATTPLPAERSRGGSRSNGSCRQRARHPARRSGHGDDGTHAHNTLSADNTEVRVFYPFHPLHGATLQILRRPKRGDGAVCVVDPAGRRLQIPVWMLLRECAEIRISQRPHLGKEALLSLASLIALQLDPKDRVHDNLLQTPVSGCEGGRRGATSTFGSDDPKGMRCRVNGRSDTRRSD